MNYQELIIVAAYFAADKHKFQRRKGNNRIPYINHPLKVSKILAEVGEYDTELLVAGLLHDVIEDTDATENELIELFGQNITSLVLEVTDDMRMPEKERKELQVTKASSLSRNAKLIKIADKLCNISDLFTYPVLWTKARKIRYVEWSYRVFEGCKGQNQLLDNLFIEMHATAIKSLKSKTSPKVKKE